MFNNPILVFDIETVPDIQTGKQLYPQLKDLDDDKAQTALMALRYAEAGNDFMCLPLHKVACLSFFWVDLKSKRYALKSLSLKDNKEQEILSTFFRAFEKTPMPTLVSWNGIGFDLPVLLYRALHHKLAAPRLFSDMGKNSYTSRYGERHIDLMDKLTLNNYAYKQKLDVVSSLCHLVGKGDIDGSHVVPMVQNGEWQKLTTYCESDVLNTWFVFLRYQILLGRLALVDYEVICADTKTYLSNLLDDEGQVRHFEFVEMP